jgi:hypothetical protein
MNGVIMGRISLENGKYTVINRDGVNIDILRYGVFWRDTTGDKFLHSLINRIEELEEIKEAKQAIIDSLMLEFCPNEMSASQVEEWAKHQAVSDDDDTIL